MSELWNRLPGIREALTHTNKLAQTPAGERTELGQAIAWGSELRRQRTHQVASVGADADFEFGGPHFTGGR